MSNPISVEKKCKECGDLYFGHPQSKYCDECRHIVRARQKVESHQRYMDRKKDAKKPPQPVRKKPTNSIVEIAKAAKAAGMSYGEFVTKFAI